MEVLNVVSNKTKFLEYRPSPRSIITNKNEALKNQQSPYGESAADAAENYLRENPLNSTEQRKVSSNGLSTV